MLNLTFEIYRIYLRMSYLPAPPPPPSPTSSLTDTTTWHQKAEKN